MRRLISGAGFGESIPVSRRRFFGKGALFLFLILILSPHIAVASHDDDAEDVSCVNSFLDKALHRSAESIEKISRRSELIFGCMVNRYDVDGDCRVMVNNTPKTVIYYRRKGGEQSPAQEKRCDSSAEAFRLASPIFTYYSIESDRKQYRVERRNDESDTRDAWVISYTNFESNGFPYVFRNATVVICAITSTVCGVAYLYPVAPEPVGEHIISRDAAQEKAREWVDGISKTNVYYWKGRIDVDDMSQIRRKVLVISDLVYRNTGIPSAANGAYHCWAVPILLQEEGDATPYSGPAVFVRVDTGDVLGCS